MTGILAQGATLDPRVERVNPDPALLTVWRPQTGYFYSRSLTGATTAEQWGESTDVPVVGDYDGDGKKDVAVWRPSTGYWYIIPSSNGQVVTHQWGAPTDVPLVGDFDGDGKADIAVWRPSNGYWYILQSSNGQVMTHQWGAPTDVPVIGDFDGDGKTDIAVWRPATGYWYITQSSNGAIVSKQWGAPTDVPVAGDFDGDGKTDIAVWRASSGYWYIVQSSNGAVVAKQWGQEGDIPVPQDYDGDGKTDLAVWRPSTGFWYVIESNDGATLATQWGASTDLPATGSLEPEELTAIAVTPASAIVLLGNQQQFTATVTGTSNTAVTWSVNGIPGGNAAAGTISSAGLYTAPKDLPNPATVTIQAAGQANSGASASAALTIISDLGVTVATDPSGMSSVDPVGVVQLLATITSAGHPDTLVNWAVNGVPNGDATVGTIAATGTDTALYTAPVTAPNPSSVTITAVCAADESKSAHLVESVQGCQLNGTIGYVAPAPYVPPSGSTCDVSDVSTLDACLTAVRSGATTNVRFTAMVNCSGSDTCLVDLSNVKGPITFFGAPGTTAGFLRTDTYTYSILYINGASQITFANLTFNDGPADPACTPYLANGSEVYPCQPTIYVGSSSGILFEQVSVLNSKQNGIAFSRTDGITIQDSVIQGAGVFGIWSGSDQSSISSNVSITNNLIQNAESNGIYLSFTQNATITRNTLQHNQYVALFQLCGGGCAGGQIDMLNNSFLQIYSNDIIDGQIDLNNATSQTDGIEIANQNANVLITNNAINHNLGVGIAADPGATGTNFLITGNDIYNSGTNLFGLSGTGIQESGDCFTP